MINSLNYPTLVALAEDANKSVAFHCSQLSDADWNIGDRPGRWANLCAEIEHLTRYSSMADDLVPVEMWVYCRRGGVSRDGGLHRTFQGRAAANAGVPDELRWLRQFYDEVSYTLHEVR